MCIRDRITPPHVDLPVPNLPQVTLPTPHVNLPDLPELPEWVQLIMEYSKIWVPLLIGIFLGIVALRNYRKSEAEKEKWREEEQADADAHSPSVKASEES